MAVSATFAPLLLSFSLVPLQRRESEIATRRRRDPLICAGRIARVIQGNG